MRRAAAAGLALSLALLLVIIALVPSTDDFALDNPFWNGMSRLAALLGARPVAAMDAGSLPGDSLVLVIGPSRPFTAQEARALKAFVERGGVLVVADDFGTANTLLALMGLRVRLNGSLLADPLFMHRSQYLPLARVAVGGRELRVYLNYGTFIEAAEGRCIGYSTPFSYIDANMNGRHDPGEPHGPFCTVLEARLGRGRLYLVADSSVFINSMLGLGDNLELARLLAGGRRAYIVADKWSPGLYTAARRLLAGAAAAALQTSLRYPLAAALGLAAYQAGRRLYRAARRRGRSAGPESEVERLLALHPGWDPDTLKRLAEEMRHAAQRGREAGRGHRGA